ncbi:MAG: peptidase S41 [Rhodothermales bacterium]|nr:peptidase S41 [Rhodothermales bacterium]
MSCRIVPPAICLILLSLASPQAAVAWQQNPESESVEADWTVRAALWLRDPAISPDGGTIAFRYGGDIFTVPTAGGDARQLTTYTGFDRGPVWSPDGTSIAFSSDRYGNFDVFTVPAGGGQLTRLTFDSRDDRVSAFSHDGAHVLFESARHDASNAPNFPTSAQPELYRVPVNGGRVDQVLTVPVVSASVNADGRRMIFEDVTSYENEWRKHHVSSAARDIWTYDVLTGAFARETEFGGEDRNPVFSPDSLSFYYLSEAEGSFNVYRKSFGQPGPSIRITDFENHPVRSLSIARDGLMAFSWNGELYALRDGSAPRRIDVVTTRPPGERLHQNVSVSGSVTEMEPSPNGKEVAFIFRGDVFVTSVESNVTKQVTRTAAAERWIDFAPDGRSLIYASERNGSWNLYESSIRRAEEKYFFTSTLLDEKTILATDADEYQPLVAPDGKTVAYLKDRMTLSLVDRDGSDARVLMGAEHFFSYGDGDQHYAWSPDSKWLLIEYSQPDFWPTEVGLVAADGSGDVLNLTDSGFSDYRPKWMMGGKMMLWFSSRDGMQSLASTGSRQADAYGLFLTEEAWEHFRLTKEEAELAAAEDDAGDSSDDDGDDSDKDSDKVSKKADADPIEIDREGLLDRKARLTIHSSSLSDAVVTPDGETLVYLARFEKGYDLWKTDLRTKETSILAKLGGSGGSLTLDAEGKNVFMLAGGSMSKVEIASGKKSSIAISGRYVTDAREAFKYDLGFAWRWIDAKFYDSTFHAVDWAAVRASYERFLPHILTGEDLSEVLNEMLGELNVSHTGARFSRSHDDPDQTAALGLMFEARTEGSGLVISEVLREGPLNTSESRTAPGVVLVKIDGVELTPDVNVAEMLNHKAGARTLISLRSADGDETWDEVVKPVTVGQETSWLYDRWVERRRAVVDSLSDGRLGYVHVRSMSDGSYRTTFEEALGKQATAEALIVDTRWNGGGDLVDDLSTFLDGFRYATFTARNGRVIGGEPQRKWHKPSILLVNEGNYSDGHCFPYAYRTKEIGNIVGMPIAGTCSWVTGTAMPDGRSSVRTVHLSFDDLGGEPLENQQLEPDVRVRNEPGARIEGRDQQLERAVAELLAELDR